MPIDDLDRLPRAPRAVPLSLVIRLRFGGAMGLIGWLFLAIGTGMLLGFSTFVHPLVAARLALDDTATVNGRVLGWSEAPVEVNEQPVIGTHFEYAVDGVLYEGISFAVDRAPEPESRVTVVYAVGDPRASRIDGMMAGPMPLWVIGLLLIFPGVGFVFAVRTFRQGGREVRALRHGRPARATATDHRPTGTTINEVPEIAVTFSYTDHLGGRHSVTSKTLEPEDLLDEAEEALLYLPERPGVAVLLDSKPDVIAVEADGRFHPRPLLPTIGLLIAPALTAAAITIAALLAR